MGLFVLVFYGGFVGVMYLFDIGYQVSGVDVCVYFVVVDDVVDGYFGVGDDGQFGSYVVVEFVGVYIFVED